MIYSLILPTLFLLHGPALTHATPGNPTYPPNLPPDWEPETYHKLLLGISFRAIRQLSFRFERACTSWTRRPKCLEWHIFIEKKNRSSSLVDKLCIQPKHFVEAPPVNFSQYLKNWHPARKARKQFESRKYHGSPMLPAIGGTNFWYLSDHFQDTVPNLSIGGKQKYYKGNGTWHAKGKRVQLNEILFNALQRRDIEYSKKYLYPEITNKHFVLVHLHDNYQFEDARFIMDSPNSRLIFADTVPSNFSHPKLIVLPMGNPIRLHSFSNELFQAGGQNIAPKFNQTFDLDGFSNKTSDAWRGGSKVKLSKAGYYHSLVSSKYVFAPPGFGLETYRVWESVFLNRVPIIEKSAFRTDSLDGLPHLHVDSFDEITPEYLQADWERRLNSPEQIYYPERTEMCYWMRFMIKHCLADMRYPRSDKS